MEYPDARSILKHRVLETYILIVMGIVSGFINIWISPRAKLGDVVKTMTVNFFPCLNWEHTIWSKGKTHSKWTHLLSTSLELILLASGCLCLFIHLSSTNWDVEWLRFDFVEICCWRHSIVLWFLYINIYKRKFYWIHNFVFFRR